MCTITLSDVKPNMVSEAKCAIAHNRTIIFQIRVKLFLSSNIIDITYHHGQKVNLSGTLCRPLPNEVREE